ncbi:hypothetical protein KR093_008954 [Drosophila rubida]|uniref:Calcium-binding protein P n=1 Tax=Drosophila rubida TaxID=30044 RepID=A0AAD4KA58_9MUSC|nr:hypothetical protein KR093_008954 [Drosophila rubida]
MHREFIYLLLSLMVIGLTRGSSSSHYSRDESSEDAKTQFNLASTFSGDINSSRHHARAHLNSQLYPETAQYPIPQTSVGHIPADIDQPAAHENGGSGLNTLGVAQLNPASNYVPQVASIYPQLPGAPPTATAPSYPPQPPIQGQPAVGYPGVIQGQPAVGYPGVIYPGAPPPPYPGFGYPGVYLPQYPTYPGYVNYPGAQGLPGNIPIVTHPQGAPTSYQNQQQYPPQYDRSFSMKTQYKEDGVHKGPFEVLNNHSREGYGSGFGGGYNGVFNRPGY